jgi:RNA polymerase sigma-70 factor (ECF subfamily)
MKVNGTEPFKNRWCERLYDAKASELLLYGRALGLSHSEAEDVLQETFLTLLQVEETPEEPEHYLVRTFRNKALNFRRSVWRRFTRELESLRWFDKTSSETAAERLAMKHLAALPAEQREIIVLKIWHRYTFEVIGGLLEISPNTAAGRYRYGIQKLKICLKGIEYERDETSGEAVAILDAATTVG